MQEIGTASTAERRRGERAWLPWVIVATGFLALSLAFSGRSALGLAMPTWEQSLGWPRTEISGGAAAALVIMALVAPLMGNAIDRRGPRVVLAGGMALVAIAMGLLAVMSQRWMFYLGFTVVGAVGFGAVATHIVATAVAQQFKQGRGLAIGIATSGATAGQLVIIPLLALLFEVADWRTGFLALAVAAALCALAIAVALRPRSGDAPKKSGAARPLAERLRFVWRRPVFHLLFWSFFLCGFTTTGVIETHLLPYAVACGYPPLTGAAAYGVLSVVNMLGMILAGHLSDRVDRPLLLATIYAGRAASFVLLFFIVGDPALLFVFAVAFGLFDYATVPVTAGLVLRHLGLETMGLAMGLISAGHAIGGALGAFLGGYLFDAFARYDWMWAASILLAALAAVLALALRAIGPDKPPIAVAAAAA